MSRVRQLVHFREKLAEGSVRKRLGVINLAYFAANASRQAAVAAFIAGLDPRLIRVRGTAAPARCITQSVQLPPIGGDLSRQ